MASNLETKEEKVEMLKFGKLREEIGALKERIKNLEKESQRGWDLYWNIVNQDKEFKDTMKSLFIKILDR